MAGPGNKRLALAAMILAVAMTFIDQSIVAIAVPELQKDLSLSPTGANLGLGLLGTILVIQNKSNIESTLTGEGVPKARADQIADAISHSGGGRSSEYTERAGRRAKQLFELVKHDFALSTRTVFYVMAGFMVLAFLVALVAMPAGKAEPVTAD